MTTSSYSYTPAGGRIDFPSCFRLLDHITRHPALLSSPQRSPRRGPKRVSVVEWLERPTGNYYPFQGFGALRPRARLLRDDPEGTPKSLKRSKSSFQNSLFACPTSCPLFSFRVQRFGNFPHCPCLSQTLSYRTRAPYVFLYKPSFNAGTIL